MPAPRTPPTEPTLTGVWVGIATITMSFAAFTAALVARQGAAADWQHFRLPPILYLNTLVLLMSSGTFELSRRRILAVPAPAWDEEGAVLDLPPQGLSWLYVTLVLGLLFVGGQLEAWRGLSAQGVFLATNPSSAFFYVLTALHGVHVLGGLGGLLYVLHRLTHASSAKARTALRGAALYWHFMAALWLYLLVILVTRV
ncbi:MAG TPA: cytochrome c oxidase subunit 3 [Gemmatimonadales bacterium]|nr:cytochrome c oxidase subunit 3 [Gemmatimonadales bacterium]